MRIKVIQVGVCGTDVHIHHGDFQAVFPLIPGHELVGTVDALGEGVTRFALGEQVSVNPNVYCGTCDFCREGRLGLCAQMKGMGSNFPGFFAEYAVVREDLVFSVEGLDPDLAVLHRAGRLRHARPRDPAGAPRLDGARLRCRPHRAAPGPAHPRRVARPR